MGAGHVEMKEQQGGMEMEVKVWQRGGDWVLRRWRRELILGVEGVKGEREECWWWKNKRKG